MAILTLSNQVPLETNEDGVVLVGGTRVTLDTVVQAFLEGAAPETIADQYPSLKLADVYGAIALYLRNTKEVDDYLRARKHFSARVQADNEARWSPLGIRQRLLARRNAKE